MSAHAAMMDNKGRRMRKLRISLLDACNLRCVYCMPETPHFLPSHDWAPLETLARIAANLVELGIEEIRLTGGEPTLRREWLDLAERLSELPLRKLGLTSNGLLLGPKLDALSRTRCQYLNLSLDSLDRENFARLTRRDALPAVLETILRARDLGFRVKVNAVMMRGMNDHEILDFVDWSGRESIPVRFLEVMKIGVMQATHAAHFLPAREMIATIRKQYALAPQADAPDSTAYRFLADNGADIGFIASESEPFCGGCSRLRLTPQGHVRPCLFTETGIDLTRLAPQDYPAALASVVALKPTGRIERIDQPMHQIGG